MASSSSDGISARLCSICLSTVVDDNSRGKAELVCGHLFHLDCIGSEFNYRNEMKCPNCRVVENGEWLIPDQDEDFEDDDDYSVQVINPRRLELHVYSHGVRDTSPTSRGQQEARLPAVNPTVHYHHNTIILPPSYAGSARVIYGTDPSTANPSLRVYGDGQASNSTQRTRTEHVVHQDRTPPRPHYPVDIASENTPVRRNTGMATGYEHESFSSHNDISLELTLTTNPSEDQSPGEQHDAHA